VIQLDLCEAAFSGGFLILDFAFKQPFRWFSHIAYNQLLLSEIGRFSEEGQQ
jgi:hypothetical protein